MADTTTTWAGVAVNFDSLQGTDGYAWYNQTITVDGASYRLLHGYLAAGLAEMEDRIAAAAASEATAIDRAAAAAASETSAAASALAAASSAAGAQAISGAQTGVGAGPTQVPRVVDLGTAAFSDWQRLPARWHLRTLTGATTLTAQDGGRLVQSAGYAVTLPSAGQAQQWGFGPGWTCRIAATTGLVTLSCAAGETFTDGRSGLGLGPGDVAEVIWATATTFTVSLSPSRQRVALVARSFA